MEAISYSALRANLAKSMDRVCENKEAMIVTRQGSESVVILPLSEYEALDETAFLTRNPANALRLRESIKRVELGEYEEKELLD